MKKTGPKNRGSHPDGLPLARSGLYISCAYLPVNSLKSAIRSSGFSDLLFHDTLAPHLTHSESMKYEGRMMKWGRLAGAFSSFIIHPSSLRTAPEASEAQQRDFLTNLHLTLNAPSHSESMKDEGRMMKWGRLTDAFSTFIIHPCAPSSASPPTAPTSSPSLNRRKKNLVTGIKLPLKKVLRAGIQPEEIVDHARMRRVERMMVPY